MYFAYDLPKKPPLYLSVMMYSDFKEALENVTERMDRLEEALILCKKKGGITDATFAEIAKKLFDNFRDAFDVMDAETLAQRVFDLWDGVHAAPEREEFPNAVTLVDAAFVTTKEWEILRHLGIGGSDASVVLGESPYNSRLDLFYDKRGLPQKIKDETRDDIFMRGHILEDDVIDAYCRISGATRIPESRMFRSKKYPYCTANPDAILRMPDGEIVVYEAKTTIEANSLNWSGGNCPVQYVPQTRQYPAVLDDDRIKRTVIGCLFVADYKVAGLFFGAGYDGTRYVCVNIERDLDAEQSILEAEDAFMRDFVIPGKTPPYELKKAEDDITTTYRFITGRADASMPPKKLDPEIWKPLADEYAQLTAQIKDLKTRSEEIDLVRKSLQRQFIEELGETIEGDVTLDDESYYEVRYAPVRGREVNYELMEAYYPKAFADCVKEIPEKTRKFTVKRKKIKKKK